MHGQPGERWIVWCHANVEADALAEAIPDAVEVRGNMPADLKERRIVDFVEERSRILLTKPRIAAWGLNLQNCARMAFVGISFSFEESYQAIRRCWRFGQARSRGACRGAADRGRCMGYGHAQAACQHDEMNVGLMAAMKRAYGSGARRRVAYIPSHIAELAKMGIKCLNESHGADFQLFHADCVDVLNQLPDNAIHFSIYSPPFGSLFTYSDSIADLCNSSCDGEFFTHYAFVVEQLLRIIKPGRLVAVHCSDLPTASGSTGRSACRRSAIY